MQNLRKSTRRRRNRSAITARGEPFIGLKTASTTEHRPAPGTTGSNSSSGNTIEDHTTQELAQTLHSKTELSKQEIRETVENKVDEYSPFLSEESAVILTAKEHGLTLEDLIGEEPEPPELTVMNLVEEMRDVEIIVTVTDTGDTHHYDGGKVRNLTVEDETGTTRVTLWDEDTELADHIDKNDKIRISGGYTKPSDYSPNGLEIHVGDGTELELYEKEELLK